MVAHPIYCQIRHQTIKELHDMFAIKKRRSSAYHSQGNGFAERNIRNGHEVFRTTLLDHGIQQKHWRSVLRDIVFVLSTSESSAAKRTPYEVVFSRKPVLPQDLLFEQNIHPLDTDIITPAEYAAELKTHMSEVYRHVACSIGLNSTTKTYGFTIITWGRRCGLRQSTIKQVKTRNSPLIEIVLGP